jgi:hypothetical protein
LLYVGLVPILAMAGFSLVESGTDARAVGSARMKLGSTTRTCLRRIHDELLSASKTAEDKNGNKVLDTGEDTNGNGRLDSDWAIGSSLKFNRRTVNSTWSPPVSYVLLDGNLIRSETKLDGKTIKASIASGVTGFSVTENDGELTVSISVRTSARRGRSLTRSGTIKVRLRN